MKLLVRNGRILDPASGTDAIGDLLAEDGRIVHLGHGCAGSADEVIDATGLWVLPGAVDMHTHLREPGQEHKETIATGSRAAAFGGVTAVACMPNTTPPADGAPVVEQIHAIARREAAVIVHVIGALSRGRQGRELAELGEMAEAGAVAFSDDGDTLMDAGLMRMAMVYAADLGRPVISHCLDASLSHGGVMREGEASMRLGLPGIPAEAESIVVARDLELARLTGVHLHVAHVSTARSVELLAEARRAGVRVSAEVTPHHLFLTDEALEGYDTNAKVSPPLGTEEDRRALGRALAEGVIDCVASDHAPHALEEKHAEMDAAPFGAVGLETLLPLVLGRLVEDRVLSPLEAVRAVTLAPARILGLDAGHLRPGAPAHVTLFDPGRRWVVDPGRLHSRGRNTPFAGWEMRGQAAGTIVWGKPVMLDGELRV